MFLKSKFLVVVYFFVGYENKNGIVFFFFLICIGFGNDFFDCYLDKVKGNKYFV